MREFPDFYYTPGKKKFNCSNLAVPTMGIVLDKGVVLDGHLIGNELESISVVA